MAITPPDSTVRRGEGFRLTCKVEVEGNGDRSQLVIRWSKVEGSLPANANQNGASLTVPNSTPADSGVYICTVTSQTGIFQQSQSRVTVLAYRLLVTFTLNI